MRPAPSEDAMVCQPVRLLADVIDESLGVDGGNLGGNAVNEVRKRGSPIRIRRGPWGFPRALCTSSPYSIGDLSDSASSLRA